MAEIHIEKARFKNSPCEWEKDDNCFEWAKWHIEGGDYCQSHAEKVIQILKDHGINVDINKIKRR